MKVDRPRAGLLVLLALIGGCAAGPAPVISGPAPVTQDGRLLPGRIAHAGGAVGGKTYTNSLEALDSNYAAGVRFFEIDFSWTRDGALVALHDWDENFERLFGPGFEAPLAEAEFRRAVAAGVPGLRVPVLDELLEWLDRHTDALLVTDVKDRNVEALELIARRRPDLRARILPQIYRPAEYQPVRELGYESIIWTLYRHPVGDFTVVRQLDRMALFAVAMPISRARQGRLPPHLARVGVPVLVHTVNNPKGVRDLKRLGVTEVYTDFLPPCEPPAPACAPR